VTLNLWVRAGEGLGLGHNQGQTKPNQTTPQHHTTLHLLREEQANYLVMNLQIYLKILIIT
jgi:hypothetical protein